MPLRVTLLHHMTMALIIFSEITQVVLPSTELVTVVASSVITTNTEMSLMATNHMDMHMADHTELQATQLVNSSDTAQVVMAMELTTDLVDFTATASEMVATFRMTSMESLETLLMTDTQLMSIMRHHLTLHLPPSALTPSPSPDPSLTLMMDSTTLTPAPNTKHFTPMTPTMAITPLSSTLLLRLLHFPITHLMNVIMTLILTQRPTVLLTPSTLTTSTDITPTINMKIMTVPTTIMLTV